MRRQRLLILLPTLIALSLLAALFITTPVFAQDEQPPQPEENPVEVVVDSTPSEEAPEAELAPGLLEEAAEAGITLVDGSGEPLALALEEAAEALAGGDPYYKVGTVTYHFLNTGGDCTPYPVGTCWTSSWPIQAAINEILNTGLPSDGTIYVESGSYSEGVSISGLTDPIYRGMKGLIGEVVDGLPAVNLAYEIMVDNVDLGFTIKGFNITANTGPSGGINLDTTKGTIKIEDVTVVNNGTGPGIYISNHNGAIVLNRVKADGNSNGGAWLENLAGTAGVTIYQQQLR